MKNIFTLLLIITSVLFINCSGSVDNTSSSSQTFFEKYNGTFWEAKTDNHPFVGDYFGFSSGSLFLQIVEIEVLNNNEMTCIKLHEGDNLVAYENFNIEIKKNTSNELWVNFNYESGTDTLKFLIKSGDTEMIVSYFYNGTFDSQETYQLTDLSYDFFCSTSTSSVPAAPAELKGSLSSSSSSSTQVTLSWSDNSTNETGFKIERKVNGGSFSELVIVNDNVTSYIDNGLELNTSYTYRIIAFNDAGNSLAYSNEVSITTSQSATIPVVFTTSISNITSVSIESGGDITSNGGAEVTQRGVVWGTSPNPTIDLETKTINESGIGNYLSFVDGLSLYVEYYLRAYATNSAGTAYGDEIAFVTSYAIGETGPAGGFIFYDKGYHSDGWRYLEANLTDYSSNGIVWWNGTWNYQNVLGISPNTGLGDGKANTLLIIVANNNLTNAAKVCNDFTNNGFSDWYLPSIGELELMCQNLYSAGIGNFTGSFYWSSTDINQVHNAHWIQFPYNNENCAVRTDLGRNMENLVRPIRQF